MALKWGSTTLGSNTNITFNGQNVTKIYYNNVLVWEKVNTCTTCNGAGTISTRCSACGGSGKCTACELAGYDNIICPTCLGYDLSWYCNGCGLLITMAPFTKTGQVEAVGVPYTCPRCGAYYPDMENLNYKCEQLPCPNCNGGYDQVTCDVCNGTDVCQYCTNGYIIQTCPTCNGSGSASGGSSSSD